MAYALLGDLEAARAAARQALDVAPRFRMSHSAYAPLAQPRISTENCTERSFFPRLSKRTSRLS